MRSKHELLNEIEWKAYEQLKSEIGDNLFLYDSQEGLRCDTFCASLLDFQGMDSWARIAEGKGDTVANKKHGFELDLIVIDHLHYFSLDKDENEIQEITAILKKAKQITEQYHIPIILIAHLRKLARGHGMPDKEDIYGTSNIHKIANTCIIIAPDHEHDRPNEGIYPTYFRFAKSRQGLRPNVLINCDFDLNVRSYKDTYHLYKCYPDGSIDKKPMEYKEMPRWAKRRVL
jgi:hypothetical protein